MKITPVIFFLKSIASPFCKENRKFVLHPPDINVRICFCLHRHENIIHLRKLSFTSPPKHKKILWVFFFHFLLCVCLTKSLCVWFTPEIRHSFRGFLKNYSSFYFRNVSWDSLRNFFRNSPRHFIGISEKIIQKFAQKSLAEFFIKKSTKKFFRKFSSVIVLEMKRFLQKFFKLQIFHKKKIKKSCMDALKNSFTGFFGNFSKDSPTNLLRNCFMGFLFKHSPKNSFGVFSRNASQRTHPENPSEMALEIPPEISLKKSSNKVFDIFTGQKFFKKFFHKLSGCFA